MSPTLTGGCNCGAVRFEITEPLLGARYCHCTRCQRRTGTAASANAAVVPGSFRIVNGETALKAWGIPPDGHEKWFCGVRLGGFHRRPHRPRQDGGATGGH